MSSETWALVPGEPKPVRVVMQGKNVGGAYCWAVELPETGEVRYYLAERCDECDQQGHPI